MSESLRGNLAIASGSHYPEFGEKIARSIDQELVGVRHRRFSNGELHCQYTDSIRGADLFNIQTFGPEPDWSPNDALMELCIMNDAAMRASARTITNVIAWYPYARQDQKHTPRVPISAALVGQLLATSGAKPFDRIVSVELHSGQIQGSVQFPLDHLSTKEVVMGGLRPWVEKHGKDNVVIMPPDAGRAVLAEDFADELGTGFAVMNKRRSKEDSSDLRISRIIGDVMGKKVAIVDDMVDTGTTIAKAAKKVKKEGADEIIVVATHPVTSNGAIDKLIDSPVKEFITTDTFRPPVLPPGYENFMKVITVTDLLGQAIQQIHREGSVSSLM